jgi:pimeloyl-ACP methyl ester carboxylesterase
MNTSRRWLRRILLTVAALVVLVLVVVIGGGLLLAPTPPTASTALSAVPPPAIDTAPGSNKPTLILLHGAGLNAHMWDAVIRDIDPRWRVLSIDLPGHGARSAEWYSAPAAREAVAAAARSVAPAPVVLAGDSLGGYSAMLAADAIPPTQLRGLVIAGASVNFPPRLPLKKWSERLMVRWMLFLKDPDELAPKALSRFGVSARDQQAILASGVTLSAVEPAVDALMGQDFLPRLRRTPQPILFVNGDGDTDRVAAEPIFLAAAPNASSELFRDTGHGVSMLRPKEFAALLNRFADRVFVQDGGTAVESP